MFNFWPTVYAVTYANLAMAHSAVQMGLKSYGVVSWSIRARLHKGLLTGTMDVGSLFADVREMPNDRCVYCAAEPPPSLYADHQIPRARGGPESGDNLVWACLSCNSRKHSRDPLEWFDLWGAFPPLALLRRYLKLAIAEARLQAAMDLPLAEAPDMSFALAKIPTRFPAPESLRWLAAAASALVLVAPESSSVPED